MTIDQFQRTGTIREAMDQFAYTHFNWPRREVSVKSIRQDGPNALLFRLVDGFRTYRITSVNDVWTITLWEPTP